MALYLIFKDGATRTNEVADTNPANFTAPDIAILFEPGEDRCAWNYLRDGGSVSYEPPVIEIPQVANPQLLKDGVFASETIPVESKVELYKYFPLLDSLADAPTNREIGWSQLVEAYGSTWLTVDVRAEVEAIAEAANMPLVAN